MVGEREQHRMLIFLFLFRFSIILSSYSIIAEYSAVVTDNCTILRIIIGLNVSISIWDAGGLVCILFGFTLIINLLACKQPASIAVTPKIKSSSRASKRTRHALCQARRDSAVSWIRYQRELGSTARPPPSTVPSISYR